MILTKVRKLSAVLAAVAALTAVPLLTTSSRAAEEPPATAPATPAAAPAADAPAATPPPPAADPLAYPPGANAGTATDLQWPIPADASSVNPDGKNKVTPDEVVQNVAHNKLSINIVWTLVTGFLVMFMQAGFALVETGLCRSKHTAHIMSTNFLIYPLGMLGFWVAGFALMFGGYWNGPVPIGWQPTLGQGLAILNGETSVTLFGKTMGIFGNKGFFLGGFGNGMLDTAIFTLFLFQMVFMDTTATIPTGAMAERWNLKNFIIYGLWVGTLAYPVYGNWVWGGGWLAQLGVNFGLGHGHVDFAGSSVVHMTGGVIGLVGAWVQGARLGKYGPDGKPRPIPGHNIPYVILGTFILAFGWFGFNPGSTLAGADNHIGIVAVNTMIASATGAFATCLYLYFTTGKPDPTMMCNGMLGGLVAITAPCAFVNSMGAAIIGAIAGILVVVSVLFVERTLKVDDPVGAVSVHGICGAFGVIAVGLFANGTYGAGWNGVHTLFKDGQIQTIVNDATPATLKHYAELTAAGWTDQGVSGIFSTMFGGSYNDKGQLFSELIGVAANFIYIGLASLIWFKLSNLIFPIRSKREDEIAGLDIAELGVEAYPDFHITDKTSPPIN